MDLEELNDNILTELTELKNQIAELKSVSKTSTTSQTDSLIFSELRTLLKEQNEQGRQNLSENAERLRSNAAEISNGLRRSVEQTKSELQNQLNDIADSVGSKVSKTLKAVERNCVEANNSFCDSVKNGRKEIQKSITEQRRAIFKSWANCLAFICAGIFASVLGILSFNFFRIQDGFYKELAETKKLEAVQREAVKDYKSGILNDPKHQEIDKLIDEWKKRNDKK